jgi:signal transduction histidine kinase
VVDADAELLKIVLFNLLLNGAHAMHGQGTIRIGLAVEGETCRILVSDSGPGMSEDVRAKVFTPFFTTKARGTGLGLATARRIVEAHGGTIGLEWPPEGGTIVVVEVPAKRSDS